MTSIPDSDRDALPAPVTRTDRLGVLSIYVDAAAAGGRGAVGPADVAGALNDGRLATLGARSSRSL